MKSRVRYKEFDQLSFADIMVYSKLPEHPFWSNLEKKIDFDFADTLCSVLYTGRGQHPYAPSLKLKIHLIQTYYHLSDRQVEEKIIGDLFIKRFLGLPVDFFGFDHSTIGLDRSRMGTAMFKACHFYILAQMYSHGLWGEQSEKWIIDSFGVNPALSAPGARRLIQQAMVRLLQHLKRCHPVCYQLAKNTVALDALSVRLSAETADSDRMLAFSKLVAQAYGLLQWFQVSEVQTLMERELSEGVRKTSHTLQHTLLDILEQNSRPIPPSDDDSSRTCSSTTNDELVYEKIPVPNRPKDRLMSAVDPEARVTKKRSTRIKGYKMQNLCSTSGAILNVSVVPANEHDREAMFPMVKEIQAFFHTAPCAVLGDTAYGHGLQRALLATLDLPVVAPVIEGGNPSKGYAIERFHYDREQDCYVCPNNKTSIRKRHIPQSNGWQYDFAKRDCLSCPLYTECTTSKKGRSVFHSDFYNYYEVAKAYNDTTEGQMDFKKRLLVERKNQELKNDCRLGRPLTKSKQTLNMKGYLAAIVVNAKLTLRRLTAQKPGFIRRRAAAEC